MSEEKDEKPVLNDPFMDEEEEDVILKTQMKFYDLFMGNWKKLLYLLGAFLIGTLVYGLYESSQQEALRGNSSRLAKSTEAYVEKNKTLSNFASLNADFQRAVDEVEKSQTDPSKIMESIQLQMKAREMNEELYFSRSLFYSLDALFPAASFVKPYAFDRASFYSTSQLGTSLSNEEPSLMNISSLRDIAVTLSETVEKLEGETKVFGYIKLGQIWKKVKELDASINAFETARTLETSPTQSWVITSQLSQVYMEKGDAEKGLAILKEYVQSSVKTDFFAEYAHLHLAMIQESLGDQEAAKATLSSITPTRFVEEFQQLRDRL